MSKIFSVMYASRNENGMHECEIEYQQTFWQWLFRRPATVKTWVMDEEFTWRVKSTMEPVTDYDEVTMLSRQHRAFVNRTLIWNE